ncbi:hypothetical protein [Alistipes senegalensis]|uniref:hypothetical protein n=1 Tax=Alistipes senegalensis TaxID=1288121 RepID=UPI0026707498|nr:hypothetical protein [Alistipes senegalensis]
MDNKQIDKTIGILGAGILTAILVGGFASIFGSTAFTLIAGAIGGLVGSAFQAKIEGN